MAQKANPLILRIKKGLKDTVFHQQVYNKKYSSYILNEQEKIYNFLVLFFQQLGLKVHSFNMIKDQKGNIFYSIKYVFMKEMKKRKLQKKVFKFYNLENAVCAGLARLGSKRPLNLLVYEITTKHKITANLPKGFLGYKFFSFLELTKTTLVVKNAKGISLILADLFCEKIENLRTKADKKLQNRLIVFIEKIFYFLRNLSTPTLKGLKIQICGRINGSARSKETNICFGILKLQQMDTKIDFFYKQVLTVFGCFGIKVWINYT